MRERGLHLDHTTIYRWVQWYAPELVKRCRHVHDIPPRFFATQSTQLESFHRMGPYSRPESTGKRKAEASGSDLSPVFVYTRASKAIAFQVS